MNSEDLKYQTAVDLTAKKLLSLSKQELYALPKTQRIDMDGVEVVTYRDDTLEEAEGVTFFVVGATRKVILGTKKYLDGVALESTGNTRQMNEEELSSWD